MSVFEGKMKKKLKFDILKTFEIFNRESLTILKDRFFEIVMLETENIFVKKRDTQKNCNLFDVDIKKDDSVQITITNDKGTYDLLSNTWQREKKKMVENLTNSQKKSRKESQKESIFK